MRAALLLALLLGASACKQQRSFDQRYADTANRLERRTATLDAELNAADGNLAQGTVEKR